MLFGGNYHYPHALFKNHIKNQHEKLLKGADRYGLHFHGDGATSKFTSLLNIYLPVSVQNIVDCIGHITGGHKKDAKFVAEIFFDRINDLDPEKKLVDLHMFDGASVCRNSQKNIEGCLSYAVIHFWIRSYLP